MSFDIVIPLGPNEITRINEQIQHVKKNVIGYRNIYIISFEPNIIIDGCIIIDERIFEFKINDISSYFIKYNGKNNRNGWYLQQLLKLYAGFTIKGILDNYLVIDADVFFLKKTSFLENDKYIFTTSDEYHKPYFTHMNKLHDSFEKSHTKSGIAHHMIFNKNLIKEMFELVEAKYKKRFWVIFIENVEEHKKYPINRVESGASEYELYFNFMIKYHNDKMIIRNLNWSNISVSDYKNNTYNKNNNYISVCEWIK